MKKNLVIMVHGLTGGQDSWTNYDGKSFATLLEENSKLSNCYDFVEFEYFTKIANVTNSIVSKGLISLINYIPGVNIKTPKRKKNASILTIAEELATFVQYECNQYDHIVFMAHSMGGLITKKFIIDQISGEYDEIQSKVSGYLSIASPHKGALPAVILGSLNINAKELTPLSKDMNDLNDSWLDQLDSLPESLYMVAKHDEFVSSVSSVPSSKRSKFKTNILDDDHNSICKPDDHKSRSYKVAESFLLKIAEKVEQSETLQTKYDPDIHSYDKEIFVVKMILAQIEDTLVDDAKESFFHADLVIKSSPRKDREVFETLKTQIMSMYKTYSSCSGDKSNSDIVKEIHLKIIELDKSSLDCAVEYINFLHKKGFLHQQANERNLKVNWCKNVTLKKIDEEVTCNV